MCVFIVIVRKAQMQQTTNIERYTYHYIPAWV